MNGYPHHRFFLTLQVLASLLAGAESIHAQTLQALDDAYGVPYGKPLMVEDPGVLDNDTLDGAAASESGVTAELVVGPVHGTLICPSNLAPGLCPDGSFEYSPGVTFTGSDSFTYRSVIGAVIAEANVTLSACSGGPAVYTCWTEPAYLAKLTELGYSLFREGFEDDLAWGSLRSPNVAPDALSQGILWTSNYPATNNISTSTGASYTGQWGIFDPDHGSATGTIAECNVDIPPVHCLYHDGVTGTQTNSAMPLYAVGAYISGMSGANVEFLVDGVPHGGGKLGTGGHQFFGVVDTAGFSQFQVREIDGKLSQALFIYSDDYIFGYQAQIERVGFWRPSNGRFYLDTNGNDRWDGPAGGDTITSWFGGSNDTPVTGDFNGDGTDDIGFWRPSTGRFYLDTNGNRRWDRPAGGDTITGWFGTSADSPVTGDFDGDGTDDMGFWRPSTGRFYLDTNGNDRWDGPAGGDTVTSWFGTSTDRPVTGDFNGDGTDEVGFWRPSTGRFYLDTNGDRHWDGPAGGDLITNWFGTSTDTPVTGDFNGDGTDDMGFWRPSTGRFYLDTNGNDRWDGPAGGDTKTSWFGSPTDIPVTGRW